MSVATMRACQACQACRAARRAATAVLISLTAGLGSLVPASQAALAAPSAASRPGLASPVTAYVANGLAETVTPITTAASTAGTPIAVDGFPGPIAITPDGKTAYVTTGDNEMPPRGQ